jgi:uncharacterized protein YndB with AHSA1/START domain
MRGNPSGHIRTTDVRAKFGARIVALTLTLIGINAQSARPSTDSSSSTAAWHAIEMTLHMKRVFAAPPDAVFRVWTDEWSIMQWFAHRANVHWSQLPALEARPGGHFTWTVIGNDDGKEVFSFHGTYRVYEPPTRLAFTWEWQSLPIAGVEGPGRTVVTIMFVAKGHDTKLTLTQTGFANQAARAAHEKGWRRCFDGIDEALREVR